MFTHAEITDLISNRLGDAGNTYFSDALIAEYITRVLKKGISPRVPLITSHTIPTDRWAPTRGEYTTQSDRRDIALTDWDMVDLIGLPQADGVEHPVDKEPKQYRNFVLRHGVVELLLDGLPDASESVYIFPDRLHILQSAIGTTDTAGAVKTTAAVGATSLALNGLGTGAINKYTKLTIAGDNTEYMVKATATISGNEATVTITPSLQAAATATAVVTLALADSTLRPDLEEVLVEWVAGELRRDQSQLLLNHTIATLPDLASAGTAIAAMSARITQAIHDLVAGRVEAIKTMALIGSASTAMGKIEAELTKAISDLERGRSKIESVYHVQVADFAQYAASDVNNARGRLNQAQGHMAQAAADESVTNNFGGLAAHELAEAGQYLNQGMGYLRKINSAVGLSNASRLHTEAGERMIAQAKADLSIVAARVGMADHNRYVEHPRS